jgi:hypothetical protein
MSSIIVFFLVVPFFFCLFLAWLFAHRARNKERLLMIEKGINPDINPSAFSARTLIFTLGIVLLCLGVGVGLIGLLAYLGMLPGVAPVAILLLSGGGGLLLAHFLTKSKK